MSPSNGSNSNGGANGRNYIEHQVSKMDTLAGVAIKYGVEVADIKRLNGLATDLQMFALKMLQIPLPGRHPPSPCLSSDGSSSSGENCIEKTPRRLGYSNILQSLESLRTESSEKVSSATGTSQKFSSAMSNLQKYYGLRSPNGKGTGEGLEMAVCRTGCSGYFDDGFFPKASPVADPFGSLIHKSRSLVNGFLHENGAADDYVPLAEAEGEGEKSNEKSVRRRQKSEAESSIGTPERLLKEENSGGSSSFSPATGKGLAMRPKSASRTSLAIDSESGWLNSIPLVLGDSIITDGQVGVRKSSSTPSFLDQDSSSSSIWPTSKWSLKPDLQALSNVSITRPIFDGLPKPISNRRGGKAALD